MNNKLYTCALCGKKVSFVSIEKKLGNTLRTNNFKYSLDDFETLSYKTYGCKNCGASDRERLYKLYFDKSGIINSKTKLLDFAPSESLEKHLRTKTKFYKSADLYMKNVDDKVDITNMKRYKNNTFDFFICSHIIEHVSDDEAAMSELYRVLKPGGRGILMTPVIDKAGIQDEDPKEGDEIERIRRFAQNDHVRLYEKRVFIDRVKKAGFKIHIYGFWNLGLIRLLRNGIRLKSRLYIVEK